MTRRAGAVSQDLIGIRRDPKTASRLVHGSAVRLLKKGVLLLGRSGSGKSDLALRLIDAGARLIADDQVVVERRGDQLWADAPESIQGLIELRGIGILRIGCAPGQLDLAVDLDDPAAEPERLPSPAFITIGGLNLPMIKLDARAPSAVARIRMTLQAERAG